MADYIWIIIIVALVVSLSALACKAFPIIRPWVITVLVVLFSGVTAYCGVQVNLYFTAEGGIFGKLADFLELNVDSSEDESKFSLKNIVLTQEEGDRYSAVIYSEKVINLENDNKYGLFINGIPDTPIDSSSEFVVSNYEYVFYNTDMTVSLEDSLKVNVSFANIGTYIKLTTEGGQIAVNHWRNYFNKNDFVIEIKELPFELTDDIDTVEQDLTNSATLTYYVGDQLYSKEVWSKGVNIKDFVKVYKPGFTFLGWSLDKENIVTSLTISSDCSLYAVFASGEILFDYEGLTDDVYEITTQNVTNLFQIDLNDHFNLQLECKRISITLDYEFLSGNMGCVPQAPITINQGESYECYRQDSQHWANITLSEGGILEVLNKGYVESLKDVTIRVYKIVAYV